MTREECSSVVDFESNLTIGQRVRINWTNSHRYFTAVGSVAKINRASVIVVINDEVPHEYGFDQAIKAPLLAMGTSSMKSWSANNRVEPVGGYHGS